MEPMVYGTQRTREKSRNLVVHEVQSEFPQQGEAALGRLYIPSYSGPANMI